MKRASGNNNPAPRDTYPSYYGLPAIRSGHWGWLVIAYFWTGGIAGGSYLISAIAHLVGRKGDEEISRWGRYSAFLFGVILSPILLVLDLGRPSRFLHMLRIFKPRSPMSVGSWGLLIFGFFAAMSAYLQAARDGLLDGLRPLAWLGRRLPFKPFEAIGSFFGLFMGGYTGVLISSTAVPLWSRGHRTNGPLFLSSALATGSAAIAFMLALLKRGEPGTHRRLDRVQVGATFMEGILLLYELYALGPFRRPLLQGRALPYFATSVLNGILLPLFLVPFQGRLSRLLRAFLTVVGGFLFRAAVILAGHESGKDPQSYFQATDPRHAE